MMRSENSFAVACRRPDGKLVVRESRWQSIWTKYKFLRWPFFRGTVVLVESLVNGFSALSFSAAQQEFEEGAAIEEAGEPHASGPEPATGSEAGTAPLHQDKNPQQDVPPDGLSGAAVGLTLVVSLALAIGLFVGVPHLLAWLMGLRPDTMSFHLVDGVIKAFMVVGYMAAISLMPEIRRVFMYHGAEHQSIATYEAGRDLVVEEARNYSRFHPRCGTSFLFLVILISILLFAATLRGSWVESSFLDQVLKIFVKIPMMLPVAGIAYEALKLSGKLKNSRLAMIPVAPGLWLQRLTTRQPDDDQLEVGLAALRKTLWREKTILEDKEASQRDEDATSIEVFDSYQEIAYQ